MISSDNCRFSSYDIGFALSSSSESNAAMAGVCAVDFLRPVPVLLFAFWRFGGAAVVAFGPPPDAGFGPRTPEINPEFKDSLPEKEKNKHA